MSYFCTNNLVEKNYEVVEGGQRWIENFVSDFKKEDDNMLLCLQLFVISIVCGTLLWAIVWTDFDAHNWFNTVVNE